MAVDQFALTSVQAVQQYMGLDDDDVRANALSVFNDSSDSTAATVQVTDLTVILIITTGGDAGTTTLTLSDAANDTLTEIVAVITALSGWQALLLGDGTADSTTLIPIAATSAFQQAEALTLEHTDIALIEALIDRASDKIETFSDRLFLSRDYREWHNGARETTFKVKNRPVTAVSRLAYGARTALTVQGTTTTDLRATVEVQDNQVVLSRFDSAGSETSDTETFAANPTASDLVTAINLLTGWSATIGTNWITADFYRMGGQDALGRSVSIEYPSTSDIEYRVDEDAGLIEITRSSDSFFPSFGGVSGTFPRGWQNILIHYTGGFATVPDDLEQVAIELVKLALDASARDSALASENLGDYSYSLMAQTDFTEGMKAKLAGFAEIR